MNSKRSRNTIMLLRWGSFTLLLLLAAVLQTIPGFLNLWGVRPVFILPVCLAVATQVEEYSAAFFGALGGLVWDFSAGRIAGLLSLALLAACFLASVLTRVFFRVGPLNFTAICLAAAFVIISMDFLFIYVMRGYGGASARYLTHVLPMILFTGALSSLWLFPAQKVAQTFHLN